MQSNLGIAYEARVHGDRADNLERAIAAYEAALTVKTREAQPREYLTTARFLGGALFEARRWREAGSVHAGAREAFLLLLGQGLNDAEARDLIARAGPLFAEAAFAAAQRGELEAALALASEGRARMMAVALRLQGLDVPAASRRRLGELRAEIHAVDRAMDSTQGFDRTAVLERLGKLRQELLALVKDAAAAESTSGSALDRAGALAGRGGAVVVPIITRVGGKILIVTCALARPDSPAPCGEGLGMGATSSMAVLDLPDLTTDRVDVLMRGDRRAGKAGGWLNAYKIHSLAPGPRYQRWPEWLAAVHDLGPELWRLVGAQLDQALRQAGLESGARLIWMPSGALGILPLGLAEDPTAKRRLADDYEIVYAPSLGALASAQKRIARGTPATLAMVINPTGDLANSEKEGTLVASHFSSDARVVLVRDEATVPAVLEALEGKSYWHFSSHGIFSWADAHQSALVMPGRAPLSVGRLLETSGLGRPRLVVLSACGTGLYDIDRNPDEFIGLPGAFTALGAAGVVGTLWPVSDAATALLLGRFYELHMRDGLSPPTALRQAQLWLRQATNAELAGYAPDAAPAPSANASGSGQRLARPYAHPIFWAGFIHTGL